MSRRIALFGHMLCVGHAVPWGPNTAVRLFRHRRRHVLRRLHLGTIKEGIWDAADSHGMSRPRIFIRLAGQSISDPKDALCSRSAGTRWAMAVKARHGMVYAAVRSNRFYATGTDHCLCSLVPWGDWSNMTLVAFAVFSITSIASTGGSSSSWPVSSFSFSRSAPAASTRVR